MSRVHYSWRAYRPGDESAINKLYFRVTGRMRSPEQWAWQWQEAPAGPGDIWLIEATYPDGRVELIGHHGVLPVRFTWAEKDILIGRTENTMVLPEYRSKILYPRFEQRFFNEYKHRYHAVFTGSGPAEALRQRKAVGYQPKGVWQCAHHASFPLGVASHALSAIVQKRKQSRHQKTISRVIFPRKMRHHFFSVHDFDVTICDRKSALNQSALALYWGEARNNWGLSQSRAPEELAWRFWNNPYHEHRAVFVNHEVLGQALFVLRHISNGYYEIVDFSYSKPSVELVSTSTRGVLMVLRKLLGIRAIACPYVEDALPEHLMRAFLSQFSGSPITGLRKLVRPDPVRHTWRRLTDNGEAEDLLEYPWGLTPLTAGEGR